MTANASPETNDCVFCAIAASQHEASVVYEDETVVAFMDRYPVTRGHVLVVPRQHRVGFEDLDAATGSHVWSVGHKIARALRRSGLGCEGMNVLVCDGEAAFQSVFHFHLHVIPRYTDDGWTINPETQERQRTLLDDDAAEIRSAIQPSETH